jgi:hypothetical protein
VRTRDILLLPIGEDPTRVNFRILRMAAVRLPSGVDHGAKLPAADRSSLRLAIGHETDLLFHHGRYAGWILESPIAHVVAEPGEAAPGADEPRLHESLRAYLALVVEPNITRMSDEDPDMRAALLALRTRLRDIDAVQARTLEGIVERVLDLFYPG